MKLSFNKIYKTLMPPSPDSISQSALRGPLRSKRPVGRESKGGRAHSPLGNRVLALGAEESEWNSGKSRWAPEVLVKRRV